MAGAFRFTTLLTTPFSPLLYRPISTIFRRFSTAATRHLSISYPSTNFRRPHTVLLSNKNLFHQKFHAEAFSSDCENTNSPHNNAAPIHPWPEWSQFIGNLLSSQWNRSTVTQGHGISSEDAFVVYEEKELSDEFIHHASVCLAFSRSRPELLSFISMKDVEVIISNGTPFLFKSALDIARRLRAYLGMDGNSQVEKNNIALVDIMKYILSYASNPFTSSERNSFYSRDLVESSVRNLLRQITEASFRDPVQQLPASEQRQFNGGYEPTPRPLRNNIEMKRGDWICPKCTFMNFARNFKCLECEEPRANKQSTGREWQCPQCNFCNHGRNLVCLRCDCKRPGVAAASIIHSDPELVCSDTVLRGNAVEGFEEITPLSELGNGLAVNARKSPLGRRQVDDKSQESMRDSGNSTQYDDSMTRVGKNMNSESSHSPPGTSRQSFSPSEKVAPNADYLRKSESDGQHKDNNLAEKSEKWFQRVAELHNVKDLPKSISDEEFPEIMPMRKGENRFVVSKKRDRSLTSPAYKREAATGHASNSNFVPFVPFPPGYFARKDTEVSIHENPSAESSTESSPSVTENNAVQPTESKVKSSGNWSSKSSANEEMNLGGNTSQSSFSSSAIGSELGTSGHSRRENSSQSNRNAGSGSAGKILEGSAVKNPDYLDMLPTQYDDSMTRVGKNMNSESSQMPPGTSRQSFSLSEKVAPNADYLRKSESDGQHKDNNLAEKSEKWFQRVAELHNVKDLPKSISDEFPQIMPMHKGENRFVVSKKRDRSLTSPEYKRQAATGDASNSNFVPFPPGYFARKDTEVSIHENPFAESSTESSPRVTENNNAIQPTESKVKSSGNWSSNSSANQEMNLGGNTSQSSFSSSAIGSELGTTSGHSRRENSSQSTISAGFTQQVSNQNTGSGSGWAGKSLEGSAVKNPDHLDMSEEAKAERWFRRVAQIKDISELSQIPDEDFPSIMPMRKGVNRFVVSKRKTPLERRLTSPQYRRNLPTVSSDPLKKDNDSK